MQLIAVLHCQVLLVLLKKYWNSEKGLKLNSLTLNYEEVRKIWPSLLG